MKLLNNTKENEKYIIDFFYADILLRIYTAFWILYIIWLYNRYLTKIPKDLFEPILWIQKWLSPTLIQPIPFYALCLLGFFLSIYTIFRKRIRYRFLLFLIVLFLNTLKWNYNSFSHVGHIFVLTHLFFTAIPVRSPLKLALKDEIKNKALSIKWAMAGILMTYSMAGFWKFAALMYKLLYKPFDINWLSKNAAELNAVISARIWDESISQTMLHLYSIPYLWQVLTLTTFFFQTIAVLGAFYKKIGYIVFACLMLFHIYTSLFINTSFYVAMIVLLIIGFPYNLFNTISHYNSPK